MKSLTYVSQCVEIEKPQQIMTTTVDEMKMFVSCDAGMPGTIPSVSGNITGTGTGTSTVQSGILWDQQY